MCSSTPWALTWYIYHISPICKRASSNSVWSTISVYRYDFCSVFILYTFMFQCVKQSRRQFEWRSLRKRARSPLLKPNGQLTYRLTRLVALGTFGALTKLSCRLSTLHFQFQELCESRGGRPGLPVLMSLTVSLDAKQPWTMLTHWSQFVPNMSTRHLRRWSSTSSSSG